MAITYDSGVVNTSYSPSEAYGMIGKVAKQIIKGITADNRLEELHRGKIENGEAVEDVVVKLIEASALTDTVPGTPFSAPENVPVVRYFNDWNCEQYKTGLTLRNVRKYLTSGKSAEEIGGIVAGQLAQSATQDDYEHIRDMFTDSGIQSSCMTTVTYTVPSGASDEKKAAVIMKKLRDTIDGMKFANTTFNKAGIKRRTLASDIRIVMDYRLKNAIDFDLLAGAFNMSKADVANKIITIDGPVDTLIVFDKNACQVWNRLYEQTEAWDAQQLRMNYFLTVDNLYGMSPLYDAVKITAA